MVVRSPVLLIERTLTFGSPLADPPSGTLQDASGGTLLSVCVVRMITNSVLGSIAVRVPHQPVKDSGASSPVFMNQQRTLILHRQAAWIYGRLDLLKVQRY